MFLDAVACVVRTIFVVFRWIRQVGYGSFKEAPLPEKLLSSSSLPTVVESGVLRPSHLSLI